MTYQRLNGKGFSVIGGLFIVLVISLVVGVGWQVWQAQDEDSPADPQELSQTVETEQSDQSVERTGTFSGVGAKTGSGSVSLLKVSDIAYSVRLEDDFSVQNGPDLFVGFGNDGEVDKDTLFTELTAFDGEQEYPVPSNIDVASYSQVFIYCKEFTVVFSVAELQ